MAGIQPLDAKFPVSAEPVSQVAEQIRSITLLKLDELAARLQQLTQSQPSFQENLSQAQRSNPIEIPLADLLHTIRHSTDSLLTACAFVDTLNTAGRTTVERPLEVGAEILPLALAYINSRNSPGNSKNPNTIGEQRLLRVFKLSGGNDIILPAWAITARGLFDIFGKCDDLPGPQVYLGYSGKAPAEVRQATQVLERMDNEIHRMRNSSAREEGPSGERTLAAIQRRDNLASRLDANLNAIDDVDPKNVPECCASVSLQVAAKAEIIDALADLYSTLGQIIWQLVKGPSENSNSFELKCFEFVDKASATGSTKRLIRHNIDASPLFAKDQCNEHLALILPDYYRIREVLFNTLVNWRMQSTEFIQDRKDIITRLERALSSIFLADAGKTKQILFALRDIRNIEVERVLPLLLCSQVVEGSSNRRLETQRFIQQDNNIELLSLTVSQLINCDDVTMSIIQNALGTSALRAVCDLGLAARKFFKDKNSYGLAGFFAHRLKRVSQDTYMAPTEGIVLLSILMEAAKNEEVSRVLKGRNINIEQIESVCKTLTTRAGQAQSGAGEFIELLRKNICRALSFDLSDYFGQKFVVATITECISEHLDLLRHPEACEGISPDQVFLNGYLLYGEPGAGKGFLVTCLSHHFGLHMVTISRRELAEAFRKAAAEEALYRRLEGNVGESQANKGDASQSVLTSFMQEKISEANRKREVSKAPASIVFIDELEAECAERDPRVSPRTELTRTNLWLEVIERLIKENPQIIFISATNHIELVDRAGLRLGRFGLHLPLKLPEKQDVIEILEGSFKRLGVALDQDLMESNAYAELVQACIQMIPLSIQIGVNNTTALIRARGGETFRPDQDYLRKIISKIALLKKLTYLPGSAKQFAKNEILIASDSTTEQANT